MDSSITNERAAHTILLGGIGGDSHSVGLTVLRHALITSGYKVTYLGIQNSLEDFFQLAAMFDVVMISSMDGHTRYYVQSFPEMKKQYVAHSPLWYLGGNLHISDAFGYESLFLEMGFDRVFVKFTDITTVLEILERDLDGKEATAEYQSLREKSQQAIPFLSAPVNDGRLEPDIFERQRRELLDHWRTGEQARDLSENAEFLCRQSSFAGVQEQVNEGKLPILMQPRCGVPRLKDQIKLFKALKASGAPVLSYQVDSLTRNNNYVGVEEALRDSYASRTSTINGFPVINHGVEGLRRVISELKVPLQTRHSTRDPRLLAEISYAGGVTAFEGGAVCYNIPYYKNYPLDESIRTWQYVDYLTGIYFERFGIKLDREFFGTLTATLVPPCLAIVVNIIETILAVQQGVKCVSLGYAEQGHRIQDIAAIRTLKQMTGEILQHLGYQDIQTNTVFHQYMAAFPENPQRAEELIFNSAITATLSGATRVLTKTTVEAYKIPMLEDNVNSLRIVQLGVMAAASRAVDEVKVAEECAIIRQEVQAIFDSVVMSGRGSIAEGVVESFRQGFLDVPFSPSIYNRGEVMTARDVEGAVRFLSTGNLQFDRNLRDFHLDKMQARRLSEGFYSDKQNHLLIERDVLQIARCRYPGWPLYG